MLTSIIILTFNQLDYTKECIESIRRYTKPGSYEIIIVDNGSTDSTKEWLDKQNDLEIIFNGYNLGFPKGCNQGIELAKGENILLLNNDVVVTENWLDNMLLALHSDCNIGAVSCVTNNCSYKQTVPTNYGSLVEMQEFAMSFNAHDPNKWEERLKLVGFCFLVKRNVIERVGLLDELFTPGNFEDDDFSIRIRQAGYKLLLCKDTFIHHFGSVSFRRHGEEERYRQLFKKNGQKFQKKWGFDSNYSHNVRHELIEMINASIEAPLRILEVGCACGGTLLGIKNIYKNSVLYGIELNKQSAQVASLIAEMLEADVEQDKLIYPEEYFDIIIFADVLEHMADPWAALKNVRKHLKPQGQILISLPNIMHYSIISKLILGAWEYEEAGILDRTHLRFFSLKEINKLAVTTGYKVEDIKGVSLQEKKEAEYLLNQLAAMGGGERLQQYKTYQYLLILEKDDIHDLLANLLDYKNDTKRVYNAVKKFPPEKIIDNIHYIPGMDLKVEMLNMLGVVHFEMEEWENALSYFNEAYQIDSRSSEVIYNIAYFLEFIGESKEASSFKSMLQQIDPRGYANLMGIFPD